MACTVTFKVRCPHTQWGQVVAIRGDHHLLTSWDTHAPAASSCILAPAPYPTWQVVLELPPAFTFSYKYVVLPSPDAPPCAWEPFSGNRRLTTPSHPCPMVVDDGEFGTLSLHRLPQFEIDVTPTAEPGLERQLILQYDSFNGAEHAEYTKANLKKRTLNLSPVTANDDSPACSTDSFPNDTGSDTDSDPDSGPTKHIPCFDCTDDGDTPLAPMHGTDSQGESTTLRVAIDDARSIVDELTRVVSSWHSAVNDSVATSSGTATTPKSSTVLFEWSPPQSPPSSGRDASESEEQVVQELLQQVDYVLSDVAKLRSGISTVQSRVRNRNSRRNRLQHAKQERGLDQELDQGQEQDFVSLDDKWVRLAIVCFWLVLMTAIIYSFQYGAI